MSSKPALVLGDRSLTFAELGDRSDRLAAVIEGMGAAAERPVAAVLGNSIEFFETSMAAAKLQAPFLPVNWHLKPDEVAYIVGDAGVGAAVAEAEVAGVPTLVAGEAYEMALVEAADAPERDWGAGPALVFYTSGTTARPKGVVHANYTGERIRMGMDGQVALWRWTADDVHLLCGPAYHAGPCGWTHTALYIGATTVIMPVWDAREWLRLVERHRVTRAFMVPAHFIRLLEVPEEERAQYDLSSLRLLVHAAAPCPVPVKRRVIEWLGPLGCEIHELYGASEGGATRISPSEWLERPGSVGLPWPGIEVRILDESSGERLPAGEQGLIYITAMAGRFEYRNDPDKTAEAWRDDAFTVGDIGYLDDEGYLFITDRASDMVLWGGVNIAPREVEEALYAHDDVVDCAVFGIPDERSGERLKAMVELRPGTDVTVAALESFVRER
ncbi:MAG: Acyl-CoA synthetase (AMP-forming)/AMP-acid ligase, partial [Acidimicrobiales bacterium]|nr:Acyl-CoA synthetase (AMP-forming)/AMP-acid ligase [Acidimicrobiales bacterium]